MKLVTDSADTDDAPIVPIDSVERPSYYNHPEMAQRVSIANIGADLALYEIWVCYGEAYYYVDGVQVDPETYRDCLNTAGLDRFCPNCMGEDDDVVDEQVPS